MLRENQQSRSREGAESPRGTGLATDLHGLHRSVKALVPIALVRKALVAHSGLVLIRVFLRESLTIEISGVHRSAKALPPFLS